MKKPRYRESFEEDDERKEYYKTIPPRKKSVFIREAVAVAFKKLGNKPTYKGEERPFIRQAVEQKFKEMKKL